MSEFFTVYYSNRIEALYQFFKKSLFQEQVTSPFKQRIIITPSHAIKSWLTMQMAQDPEIGIATGMKLCNLNEAIRLLENLMVPESSISSIPSTLELTLAIEVEIYRLASKYVERKALYHPHSDNAKAPGLSDRSNIDQLAIVQPRELSRRQNENCKLEDGIQPLFDYLDISSQPFPQLSIKSQRRITTLAQQLRRLFCNYGIYGSGLIKEWEEGKGDEWQSILWRALYKPDEEKAQHSWSYPAREIYRFLKEARDPFANVEVHLFSVNYLAPIQHAFFTKAASFLPVSYYLLSPCHVFWSDLPSDRETRKLHRQWKRRHPSDPLPSTLEEFLRNRNPLLANVGKLGKEMARLVEESEGCVFSLYQAPESIQNHLAYRNLGFEEVSLIPTEEPLTCLQAVQADLLLLRNPEDAKIEISKSDVSIQIHEAGSRMREVQVVYNLLVGLLQKHASEKQPIQPSSVLVMAPDISQYEPFIRAVFDSEDSILNYRLMDVSLPSQRPLIQGFLQMLQLADSRWEIDRILDLFNNAPFLKKHRFSMEEIGLIREWLADVGVRWGQNGEHRDSALKRSHCKRGMVESTSAATWKHGFSRLLQGLAFSTDNSKEMQVACDILPLDHIEPSQGDLLGRLISLLHGLQADLEPLINGTKLSLIQWASYLDCLAESYFIAAQEYEEDLKILSEAISSFRDAQKRFEGEVFSFITIISLFKQELDQRKISYRESSVDSVSFCSLLPMRAIPADIVVLMGMEENGYPKQETRNSLNLIKTHSKADFCPSQTDYDRFLFLESLLSARRYFIMSYPAGDGEGMASLLVEELKAYLDQALSFEGNSFSNLCLIKHPFHAFDASYFSPHSSLKSYLQSSYRAALAFYYPYKDPQHLFIPSFAKPSMPNLEQEENTSVTLKQLTQFASNPLKVFFNQALNVYVSRENREAQSDESFVLTHLELARLRKEAALASVDDVLKVADKKGVLPLGGFKQLAEKKVREDAARIELNLKKAGTSLKQALKLCCSDRYCISKNDGNYWELPPLEISCRQYKSVKITGELLQVTPQGIISHHDDKLHDGVKEWPQLLFYLCLIKQHHLLLAPQLISSKTGKVKYFDLEDPFGLLSHYLDYYFESLKNPSPLIPEFVEDLWKYSADEFDEQLKDNLRPEGDYPRLHNDYLSWMYRSALPEDSADLGPRHIEIVKRLYTPLFDNK